MRSFLRKFNHIVLGLAVYCLGLQPAFANLVAEEARVSRALPAFAKGREAYLDEMEGLGHGKVDLEALQKFAGEVQEELLRALDKPSTEETISPEDEKKAQVGVQLFDKGNAEKTLDMLKKLLGALSKPSEEETAMASEDKKKSEDGSPVLGEREEKLDTIFMESLKVLETFSKTKMSVGEGYSQALAHAIFIGLEDLKHRFKGLDVAESELSVEGKAQAQQAMEMDILSQGIGLALAKWMEFDNGGDSAFFHRILGLQGFFDHLKGELGQDILASLGSFLDQLRMLNFSMIVKDQLEKEEDDSTAKSRFTSRMEFVDYFEILVSGLNIKEGILSKTPLQTALEAIVGVCRKEAYHTFVDEVAAKAGQVIIDMRHEGVGEETLHETLYEFIGRNLRALPGIGTLTGAEFTAMGMNAMNLARQAFFVPKEDKTNAYADAMALGSDWVGTSAEFVKRFTWSFLGGVSNLLERMRASGELKEREGISASAHAKKVAQLESELEESRAILSRVIKDALEDKSLLEAYGEAEDKAEFLNKHLTERQIARVKREIAEQRFILEQLAHKRPFSLMDDQRVAQLEEQQKEAVKQADQAFKEILQGKELWEEWGELLDKDKPNFLQTHLTQEEWNVMREHSLRVQLFDGELSKAYTLKPVVMSDAIYRPLGAEKASAFVHELLYPVLDASQVGSVFAAAQAQKALNMEASKYAKQAQDLQNLRKNWKKQTKTQKKLWRTQNDLRKEQKKHLDKKKRDLRELRKTFDPRAENLFRVMNAPGALEQELAGLYARDGVSRAEPLSEAEQARLTELEEFRSWYEMTLNPMNLKQRLLSDVTALADGERTYHEMMAAEDEDAIPSPWSRFKNTRIGSVVTHPLFWGAVGFGALAYSGWDPIGHIGPRGADAAMTTDVGGSCSQILTFGCKRIVNGTLNQCYENSQACCPNPLGLSGVPGNGTGTVTITTPLPGFTQEGFPFGAEVFYQAVPGWTINSQVVGSDRILTFEGNLTLFDQEFGCVQGNSAASQLYFQPRDSESIFDWRVNIIAGPEGVSASTFFTPVPNNDPPTVVEPFTINPSLGQDVTANGVRTVSGITPPFPYKLHDIDGAQKDNPPQLEGMRILQQRNFALTRGGSEFPPNVTHSGQDFKNGLLAYSMTCDSQQPPWMQFLFCDYDDKTASCFPGSKGPVQTWSQACPPAADPDPVVVAGQSRTKAEKLANIFAITGYVAAGISIPVGALYALLKWEIRNDTRVNPLPSLVADAMGLKTIRTDTKFASLVLDVSYELAHMKEKAANGLYTENADPDAFDPAWLADPANGGYTALKSVAKAMGYVFLQEGQEDKCCTSTCGYRIIGRNTRINIEGLRHYTVKELAYNVLEQLRSSEEGKGEASRARAWCCCRSKSMAPSKSAMSVIRKVKCQVLSKNLGHGYSGVGAGSFQSGHGGTAGAVRAQSVNGGAKYVAGVGARAAPTLAPNGHGPGMANGGSGVEMHILNEV